MLRPVFALFIWAILSQGIDSGTSTCQDLYNANCLLLTPTTVATVYEADLSCNSQLGGQLVKADEADKRVKLLNIMAKQNCAEALIGLNDMAQRGVFRWLNGTLFTDNALWDTNALFSSSAELRCVTLNANGKFRKRPCTGINYAALCESGSSIPSVIPPYTWTNWTSVSTPSLNVAYEAESLSKIRAADIMVCPSPLKAECRVVNTKEAWNTTGDIIQTPCTEEGLLCQNSIQKNKTCQDYEVRFLCYPDIDECALGTANCDRNAVCTNTHGSYQCRCNPGFFGDGKSCYRVGVCTAYGDPHYRTYDGVTQTFMGICKYIFSQTCSSTPDNLTPFKILVANENRNGNLMVSYTKSVSLYLGSSVFTLKAGDNKGTLWIDGVLKTPPQNIIAANSSTAVSISVCTNGIELLTNFGLSVVYDGISRVEVRAPVAYKGYLCGMCGNYDGSAANDLQTSSGKMTTDQDEWGNSWLHPQQDSVNCTSGNATYPVNICSKEDNTKAKARCALLTKEPSFQQCWSVIDPAPAYDSCVYDVCSNVTNDYLACAAFNDYAKQCETLGVLLQWRLAAGCPPQCGANEHYAWDTNGCQNSCDNPDAELTCYLARTQGCVCDEGYVRSGTICVPRSQCGCKDANNNYRAVKDEWFTNQCSTRQQCVAPNQILVDSNVNCGANGNCVQVANSNDYDCQCKKGYTGKGNNCTDVNECVTLSRPCNSQATCLNQMGSYTCKCNPGFVGDGYLNCTDVDECNSKLNNCSPNAVCYNDVGTYHCSCNQGYTGDGFKCERDVVNATDPEMKGCSFYKDALCHPLSDCVDLPSGSIQCVCWEGAIGNGMLGANGTGCAYPKCPSANMLSYESFCYLLTDTPGTYEEMASSCMNQGGDLMTFVDVISADFVRKQVVTQKWTGQFYTGYRASLYSGVFMPNDFSISVETSFKWNLDQMSTSNSKVCATYGSDTNYTIIAADCTTKLKGLCKIPTYKRMCSDGWRLQDNRCVALMPFNASYTEAAFLCSRWGGDLYRVKHNTDLAFLRLRWLISKSSGNFWVTSSTMTCSAVRVNGSLTNDVNCTDQQQFFCEKPINVYYRCPVGSEYFNGNCYAVTANNGTRSSTENVCQNFGGQLTSITSSTEQAFLEFYLNAVGKMQQLWIGLNENYNVTGLYSWSDGAVFKYTNWATDFPNNLANDCGYLSVDGQRLPWKEATCNALNIPGLCKYINTPCANDSDCHVNAYCQLGQCRCKKGYLGDGKKKCADINECMSSNVCPGNLTCSNTDGGFTCGCQNEYIPIGNYCFPQNYCTSDSDCSAFGYCLSNNSCTCRTGFSGNGKNCTDIDECSSRVLSPDCNENSICNNTVGSYKCTCKPGYIPHPLTKFCVDFPRTCHEHYLLDPNSESKYYTIDPDRAGPLPPVSVSCNMRSSIKMGITEIKVTSRAYRAITKTEARADVQNITYTGPSDSSSILAIVGLSNWCYQDITYICKGTVNLMANTITESLSGVKSNTWGYDGKQGYCQCGVAGCCRNKPSTCNCDGTFSYDFLSDKGRIVNRQLLPLTRVFSGLGASQGSIPNEARFQVGNLYCGPDVFDMPLHCDDFVTRYGKSPNAYEMIHPGGPSAFPVCCEGKITIVPPENFPGAKMRVTGYYDGPMRDPPPAQPTDPSAPNCVSYPTTLPNLQSLIQKSPFCTQEVMAKCNKGQSLLQDGNYLITLSNKTLDYFAGGSNGKCACGVLGLCANRSSLCNCDGSQNSYDFGHIRDKNDLPVMCLGPKTPQKPSTPPSSVGPLKCGPQPFNLEPNCGEWNVRGYTRSYAYQIDVDGGSFTNQNESLVYCNMDAVPFVVIYPEIKENKTRCANPKNDLLCCLDVRYPGYTPDDIARIVKNAAYCTQDISYTCQKMTLTKSYVTNNSPYAYWKTPNDDTRYYFDGDNVNYVGCACGNNKTCSTCYCDVKDKAVKTDSGVLTNKGDLPVSQLCLGKLYNDSTVRSEQQLGPLKCYYAYPTCKARYNAFYDNPSTEKPYLPDMTVYIDSDGPRPLPPTMMQCTNTMTIVSPDIKEYTVIEDFISPNKQCWNITYGAATLDFLRKLTSESEYCSQYGSLQCVSAQKTGYVTLYGADGNEIKGWFGNAGGTRCACGETVSCVDPKLACNCDSMLPFTTVDDGILVDKSVLPLTRICVSLPRTKPPTGVQRSVTITLSNLQCTNSQYNLYPDCQRMRESYIYRRYSETFMQNLQSQAWVIDPDGDGGVKPFTVYCDMSNDPAVGVTIINTNVDCSNSTKDVDIPLTYGNVTLEQIAALAGVSTFCEQTLKHNCLRAPMNLSNVANGAFDNNGARFNAWGTSGCKGSDCQCDSGSTSQTVDVGRFYDKMKLPVTKVHLSAIANNKGSRSMCPGPLKCYNLYPTCQALANAGRLSNPNQDNEYALMPLPERGLGYFEVLCNEDASGIYVTSSIIQSTNVMQGNTTLVFKNAASTQLHLVTEVSAYCAQELSYTCMSSGLLGLNITSVTDYSGSLAKHWTGVVNYPNAPSVASECSCKRLGTCGNDTLKCRCDAQQNIAVLEGGLFLNQSALPLAGSFIQSVPTGGVATLKLSAMRCATKPFNLPSTCDMAQSSYKKTTGEVTLLPACSNMSPIDVYCDMNGGTNSDVPIAYIPTRFGVQPVSSNKNISYPSGNLDSIRCLVSSSSRCVQYIRFESKGASLSGKFSWIGANGQEYNFFAGGSPENFCPCQVGNTCASLAGDTQEQVAARRCNSDLPLPDGVPRQVDVGYISDLSALPVVGVRYTGSAEEAAKAKWSVGPLMCASSTFDINECSERLNECDTNAECNNDVNTYTCSCKPGWTGIGGKEAASNGRTCYDADECTLPSCPTPESYCVNSIGSYDCPCSPGYEKNADNVCVDIDECAKKIDNCDTNAKCINTVGNFTCLCNAGYRGTGRKGQCYGVSNCYCFGDPHCFSWDGRWLHYQGSCRYTLARDNCRNGIPIGEPTFSVTQKNWRRNVPLPKVSWTKEVLVRVYNTTILLQQSYSVVVNGRAVTLPFTPPKDPYNIQIFGMNVIVSFDSGMLITWDGVSRVEVLVTENMKNSVCGLCGNYNNNPEDDWIIGPACQNNGTKTNDSTLFGDSWRNDNPKDTDPMCEPTCNQDVPEPQCLPAVAARAKTQCAELTSRFALCAEAMKNQSSTEMDDVIFTCEYDYCQATSNAQSVVCEQAALLAALCLNKYQISISYMDNGFCAPTCGKNMIYNKKGSPCQASCTQSAGEVCNSDYTAPVEGCFCKPGYVMESGNCILPSECGCRMSDGTYFKVGSNYTAEDCSQFCECKKPNSAFSCRPTGCGANAFCAEVNGVRGCYCDKGYFGDGYKCSDVNECKQSPSPCGANAKCTNTLGSYNCTCLPGYLGNGLICDNINECNNISIPYPCNTFTEECFDLEPFYECRCKEGYVRYNATSPCEDKNECDGTNNLCDRVSTSCLNTVGSYKCTCKSGFIPRPGSAIICDDIDECQNVTVSKCDLTHGKCVNMPGSFACVCDAGYRGDGTNCTDIDECDENASLCSTNTTKCTNTDGGYKCDCLYGSGPNSTDCLGPDPCRAVKCPEYTACVDGACLCVKGYERNDVTGQCDDVDECIRGEDNCSLQMAKCHNIDGSYLCLCLQGYRMNPETRKCENINECTENTGLCNKNAVCKDTMGGYYCECDVGFTGHCDECRDIDECENGNKKCDAYNAICTNTIGSYKCSCKPGFDGDGKTCVDVDECTRGGVTCKGATETCLNTYGSYDCECIYGYGKDANGNCTDINECINVNNDCSSKAECINLPGTYSCRCKAGYKGDGIKCVPDDNHQACGDTICPLTAKCDNGKCVCKLGFVGNGSICTDVDECTSTTACDMNAFCENIPGSYFCSCKPGYRGNGVKCYLDVHDVCQQVNYCRDGKCENNTCTCPPGLQLVDTACVDINECAVNEDACPVGMLCANSLGSYSCGCSAGLRVALDKKSCIDVNECEEGYNNCQKNSKCQNLYGSYRCYCDSGMQDVNNDGTWCESVIDKSCTTCQPGAMCIDGKCQCLPGLESGKSSSGDAICVKKNNSCTASPCPQHATCQEKSMGYGCQCNEGYKQVGTQCVDVDECSNDQNPCNADSNQLCVNIPGSYVCLCATGYKETQDGKSCEPIKKCNCGPNGVCTSNNKCICSSGYQLNVAGVCEDIDECMNKTSCHAKAICTNSDGGYQCQCRDGYTGNPYQYCDLDECALGLFTCTVNEKCVNLVDSYTCIPIVCSPGLSLVNGVCVPDSQMCRLNSACGPNQICVVTDGVAHCQCRNGFSGDGNRCLDINECLSSTVSCPDNSVCFNTIGSYECICRPGFQRPYGLERNGTLPCKDIDECLLSSVCADNADCVNVVGSYTCTCKDGYVGMGRHFCEEDTSCQATTGCHPKALCRKNVNGTYGCQCMSGYEGDGVVECLDSDPCRRIHGSSCHAKANCIVTNTTADCRCQAGFIGNGYQFCEDVDECADTKLNKCKTPQEKCVNKHGSYECVCGDGTVAVGGECRDVDECESNGKSMCSPNAACNNTLGGYSCTCKDGFFGDGKSCQDIDECLLGIANCNKNELCVNTAGGFDCTCKAGLIRENATCVDIDECAKPYQTGGSYCSENAKCLNLVPGYTCECNKGYVGDGFVCVKDTPCNKPGICPRNNTCVLATNNVTYTCVCKRGYELQNNACLLVNPCASGDHTCDNDTEICLPLDRGYRCECKRGYKRVNGVCTDKDECDPQSPDYVAALCKASGGKCKNTPGSYVCICPSGLSEIPGACKDKNECVLQTHNCNENATCMNTVGGYHCRCKYGYEGDGITCIDRDECALKIHMCSSNAECVNTVGSYLCVCPPGYTLDDSETQCLDTDECANNTQICGDNAACINTLGSYTCVCSYGYERVNNICQDIDECKNKTNPCHENAVCTNTMGSCTCKCRDGYDGDGKLKCQEIDQCTSSNKAISCPANSFCKMVNGAATCSCLTGYGNTSLLCTGDKCQGSCVDVNECVTKSAACHPLAKCKNNDGAYQCTCPAGTQGDGKRTCEDINECVRDPPVCNSATSVCVNRDNAVSPIPYECQCKPGFVRVPGNTTECVDKNECLNNEDNDCGQNSICNNTEGGYVCSCTLGYQWTSDKKCQDVDECTVSNPCGLNNECVNTPGSYRCKCLSGYTRDPSDSTTCIDINECTNPTICKDVESSVCINTAGSYSCICQAGFVNVKGQCSDVDECSQSFTSLLCKNGSTCLNTVGSYSCQCQPGYRALPDGSCEFINECQEGLDTCKTVNGPLSTCYKLDVGYGCTCPKGFKHDADSPAVCIDINECVTGANNCSVEKEKCVNTPGSYRCDCKPGYDLVDDVCKDRDECKMAADSKVPLCRPGTCLNTPGSYVCLCPRGYDNSTQQCIDINECTLPKVNPLVAQCGDVGECVNTPGSYKCTCNKGYANNPSTQVCEDVNECIFSNSCPNGVCTNTPGSYICVCRVGYVFKDGSCVDMDECLEDPVRCGDVSSGTCNNTEGSYRCECKPGYQNSNEYRTSSCIEINECVTKNVTVPPNSECVDEVNGYSFRCKAGYRKDDMSVCRDIDECAEINDACAANAICTNTEGSYTCQCKQGFRGDAKRLCNLICDLNTCPNGGICRVTNGMSYTCECSCVGEQCRTAGSVCDNEGRTHNSEKDMYEYGCKLGRALEVDYYGPCKDDCKQVTCPLNETCVLLDGKPSCECDMCSLDDIKLAPICTESGLQLQSMCQYKERRCATKTNDPIAYYGPCKRPINCVLGPWTSWSICSRSCEIGVTTRKRLILKPAKNGGDCGPVVDTEQCYSGPCPNSPCETMQCPPGSYCYNGVCLCPKCFSTLSVPVCGKVGSKVDTYNSLCNLQKAACLSNQNYTFLHHGECGEHVPSEPTLCSVVEHFRIEQSSDGCYSSEPLPLNKCDGGCGLDPSVCCQATEYTPQRVLFRCPDKSTVYRYVNAITACSCVKESTYKTKKG